MSQRSRGDHGSGATKGADPAGGTRPETGARASEVRSELRRLGYLDHQVERFLLQDALRRTPPWRALVALALKVGLLIGTPSALVVAVAVAAGNGHLRHSPFDLLPLAAHLLVPAVLGLAAAFLALAGLLALIVRFTHARRIEALSFALALLASAGTVIIGLWQGRAFVNDLPNWLSALLALFVPIFAWGLFKVAHGGLLSLAIRLTEAVPEQPFAHGRWWVILLMLGTFLVMVPTALEVRRDVKQGPAVLPEVAGDRVLVLGVDGVIPQEIDFLLASGELPTLSALLESGGVMSSYARTKDAEPITFWTTLATGLPAAEHGLESLDTYRPAGVKRPLRRSGLLRHWWHILTPGLAEYRPLLANQRRSWAFWELAGRGGAPVLVVNWWGTFPVEPNPGRVIAHGAYQLIQDGAKGVVHPPGQARGLEARVANAKIPTGLEAGLERVLPEGAESLLEQALRPDVFYRQELRRGLQELKPRAAALYLPGLDIAADGEISSVALSELVRFQLHEVDKLLADALAPKSIDPADEAIHTVLVVFDAGRRGGSEGRALLWRQNSCAPPAPETATGEKPNGSSSIVSSSLPALTSGIMRALGLPHHRALPQPPAFCTWPQPALEVDGFGPRRSRQTVVEGQEYLDSLKSLGYL